MNPVSTYRSVVTRLFVAGVFLAFAVGWPQAGYSATNEATDPGGGGISLIDSGPVTVNSVNLALVKQARDLAGTVLPGGSNVAPGQQIYFVLYVDNVTDVTALNNQLTDNLSELDFTFIPGTLETTVVPSGSGDAAIWAGAWVPLSDAVGGPDDLASITDTGGPPGPDRITIGAVPGQANQVLNITGNTLRAIRFQVTVN